MFRSWSRSWKKSWKFSRLFRDFNKRIPTKAAMHNAYLPNSCCIIMLVVNHYVLIGVSVYNMIMQPFQLLKLWEMRRQTTSQLFSFRPLPAPQLVKTRAALRRGPCKSKQICGNIHCHWKIFIANAWRKNLVDLENDWQSDRTQHPELCHSIANIKIYKRHYTVLRLLSPFPRYYHFNFSQLFHSTANMNFYLIKVIARISALDLTVHRLGPLHRQQEGLEFNCLPLKKISVLSW